MSLQKAVSLVSGGMDSLVTLALALEENDEVFTLHMSYGQNTAEKEKNCFKNICDFYEIPGDHRLLFEHSVLGQIGGSSLTDDNIPVSFANLNSKDIPTSYVPFRNAHMICNAVSWAEIIEADKIYIGAVEEDSSGYPDCRESYYQIFNQLISEGTRPSTKIEIKTPLIQMSKKEIVLKGNELKVPFQHTWSCYQSSDKPCLECDSCALRLRGFEQTAINDPLTA